MLFLPLIHLHEEDGVALPLGPCILQKHYPVFQLSVARLSSSMLLLPFIHLQEVDGIVLPDHVAPISTDGTSSQSCSDNDNEDIEWRRGDDRINSSSRSFLCMFEVALTEALVELGGDAVPKIKWSVPRDAASFVRAGMA